MNLFEKSLLTLSCVLALTTGFYYQESETYKGLFSKSEGNHVKTIKSCNEMKDRCVNGQIQVDQCVTQLRQCSSIVIQFQEVMKRCKLYCGPERKLPRT